MFTRAGADGTNEEGERLGEGAGHDTVSEECPRKGTTRPGRGLVVRTSSIGGVEKGACSSYSQHRQVSSLDQADDLQLLGCYAPHEASCSP